MDNFNNFLNSQSLKDGVENAIKDAGGFPKLNNEADLSRYIQQVAFNVALETVHVYHEWLAPQLKG